MSISGDEQSFKGDVVERLTRVEVVVGEIREDVGDMKSEWERIRRRVHALENDSVAAKAAKAALEVAQSVRAEAHNQKWTRWVALGGAVGGITAFITLLVSLFR